MYIPEKRKNRQITLFDFNQSCGMELDPINERIKLAHAIPWSKMEAKYVAMFPSKTGTLPHILLPSGSQQSDTCEN